MSWKAHYPPAYSAAPARFLIRESIGLIQVSAAAALICALAGHATGQPFLGVAGEWIAGAMIFSAGQYVPYLLAVLFGVAGFRTMITRGPIFEGARAVAQALGGFIFVIAACGVMAFAALLRGRATPEDIYAAGGILGGFLLDGEGLNLARGLGEFGGLALVAAMALIGSALYAGSAIGSFGVGLGRFLLLWVPFQGDAMREATPSDDERASAPDAGEEAEEDAFAPPPPPPYEKPPRRRHLWSTLDAAIRWVTRSPRPRPKTRPALPAPRPSRVMPGPITEIQVEGQPSGRLGLEPPDSYEPVPDTLDADWEEPWLDDEARATDERIARTDDDELPPRVIKPAARRREKPEPPRWSDDEQTEIRIEKEEDSADSSSRVFKLKRGAPKPPAEHPEFDFSKPFELPKIDLLAPSPPAVYKMTEEEATLLSRKIEETLAQFKIDVQVIEIVQGPTVTRFALQIAPGIRVSRILALESDLALALKAHQIRVLAPIPGQAAVGIEVPNKKTNAVFLRELLESEKFQESKSPLTFALGKNISGEAVIADLAQMPHLLIAGATGAGKSVCLNTIIASMLFRNPPDKVKMIMIDPKRVELSVYQAIPHLLAPVVCEPRKASAALAWAVEQMESRYKLLAEIGVRNIDGYNAVVNDRQGNRKAIGRDLKVLPHMVVIIDELADLMMVAKNEVEEYIIRLAQMARAVGIHMILATQRPSVNVITGIIKANFPSRIAFRVSSKVDSRTILDANGAEALLGRGDMLYSPGGVNAFRLQGAFVSDDEIERLADYIRAQEKARYEKDDFETPATAAAKAKAQLMASALGPNAQPQPAAPPPGMQIGATGGFVPARSPDFGGLAARGVLADSGDAADESPFDDVGNGETHGVIPGVSLSVAGRAGSAPLPPADMESLTDEDLYDVALRLVLESRKASVSYIQRRLKIGYARAGRLMDLMEERGIVGPYQGSKPRELIVNPHDLLSRLNDGEV